MQPPRPPATDHPLIQFDDVSVTYGRGKKATPALAPTNLKVAAGDFVALVGPSGCGKSTILKIVSELLAPSGGHVFSGGRELGANPVRVGMAFQSSTLLPWKTIRANVMLPLKIVQPFRGEYRAKKNGEFRDRVDALLEHVGLIDFADNHPYQLSGGMQQRANLARALVHEPDLLLLDEPFGALDQFTREELWLTLQDLWQERRSTVLLVTHDLREAAFLANRVIVMSPRPGRILEDRAIDFARPRSLDITFEADFTKIVQDLRALIVRTPTGTARPLPRAAQGAAA
ncbi:ABC transporter ATP-binding protein [Acuticoccus sp. MNP-M23]|uniref:ABC transporter ATP-binding protein n=1 Tax=Acuticoccus sp. MNP-M23 TaxID=3072793 RepID=UPI00281677AF|nr:ABC transporter ATP-binding protein [Acuticoccus sp. MNP-M23]WMS42640.1 ABC transporter ATP-binding protein [Acuticoccus sp. MNP-M23]